MLRPNSRAVATAIVAVKIVKFVAIEPTRVPRIAALSAIGTKFELAICQTSPRLGSHVSMTKTMKAETTASAAYLRSEKTRPNARHDAIVYLSLSATSTIDLTAA